MARHQSTEIRFWKKVQKSENGCWLWTASVDGAGYGYFQSAKIKLKAHRYSWELENGPIPTRIGHHGLCVLHSCDTKICVNPSHLSLGTQKDNIRDMDRKHRRGNLHGSTNPNAVLTEADIPIIRTCSETDTVQSKRYGVTRAIISRIKHRVIWKHVA